MPLPDREYDPEAPTAHPVTTRILCANLRT